MSETDTTTILAVPCDQAVVLTSAQGEQIVTKIKSNRASKEDKS